LRFSDRRRLAETGTLGDLSHDVVPPELAQAIRAMVETADPAVRERFLELLTGELMEHFGRSGDWRGFFLSANDRDATEKFLDAVEIFMEFASKNVFQPIARGARTGETRPPIPDVHDRVNRAFERFRFGYHVEGGEIRRIGSPALDEAIVGPALLAVQRSGWEEAERSYREALDHQRRGETDDALTAASAAVEAALKAAGMRGRTLKELARSFKGSGLVPGYLANVPELIEGLLDRLYAARSIEGDVHGNAPGAPAVPPELADLAIYWAGAFISYLADATRSEASGSD
jgi:hypothetical protein